MNFKQILKFERSYKNAFIDIQIFESCWVTLIKDVFKCFHSRSDNCCSDNFGIFPSKLTLRYWGKRDKPCFFLPKLNKFIDLSHIIWKSCEVYWLQQIVAGLLKTFENNYKTICLENLYITHFIISWKKKSRFSVTKISLSTEILWDGNTLILIEF